MTKRANKANESVYTNSYSSLLDTMTQSEVLNKAMSAYPAQAIVNMKALQHNMQTLVNRVHSVSATTAVMGVVKANAYGHGLLPVALCALAGGATWLGTAQASEALRLRQLGIGVERARILTWMYNAQTAPFTALIDHDIDISVGSLDAIERLVAMSAESRQRSGKVARVHIKVDSGFGRNGFTEYNVRDAFAALHYAESQHEVQVVGIWSHLAVADSPNAPESVAATDSQLEHFEAMIHLAETYDLHPTIRHIANTAATLTRPESYYDLVRPGIGLYGYEPDVCMGSPEDYNLIPAMTLQAQLGTVKRMSGDHGISYGRTYITDTATSTAVLPIGYADGIHRSASGFNVAGSRHVEHLGGPVAIRTTQGMKVVRVSGRVCMDQCVLDLHGDAQELGVHEGDTVVLFGAGRGIDYGEPTADDWAIAADTISYEIFTCLGERIPRVYRYAHEVLSDDDCAKLSSALLM